MPLYPQGVAFPLGNIPQSHRNILGRNGGLEVWQRGAGNSTWGLVIPGGSGGRYMADGWYASPAEDTWVGAYYGLTANSRWSMYCERIAGTSAVGLSYIEYALDTDEIVLTYGQPLTLSFTAFRNTGWTSAGGNLGIEISFGTGAAPSRAAGMTARTWVLTTPVALTTTAARYSVLTGAPVPSTATQVSVVFTWSPVGVAPAGDSFFIDDVQLEVGSVATPFERRPFESELAACQRHYWKTFDYNTAPVSSIDQAAGALGFVQVSPASAGQAGMCHSHPVRMRSAPTVTLYNPLAAGSEMRNIQASADCAGTNAQARDRALMLQCSMPAGSLSGQWLSVHATCDAGI